MVWQCPSQLTPDLTPHAAVHPPSQLQRHLPGKGTPAAIPNTHFVEKHLTTSKQKALESFYGIGPHISAQIMARHYLQSMTTVGALGSQKLLDLTAELTSMKIENDARMEMRNNIKRLRDMGTYRGRRHAMGLPVRGQNTRGQVRANHSMIEKCRSVLT